MSKYIYPHTIGIGISMAPNFKGMVQRHRHIYLLRKVVCLFCLYVESSKPWHPHHALGIVEKPSMSKRCIEVIWYCLDLKCENYWILNNFVKINSTKWKPNILRKLRQAIDILGKPLMSGISWRWFHNFLDLRGEILNFQEMKSYHWKLYIYITIELYH
jgi:hypothetical protein